MRHKLLLLAGAALGSAASAAPPRYAPLPAAPKIDVAAIQVPDLVFTPSAGDVEGFDKYFYFHREGTDFETAFADVRECDNYARGSSIYVGGGPVPYPYTNTMAGAVGGAIGSAVADAIFGSAERRKQRRANLKKCMGFKEYRLYGAARETWFKFNFEEGNSPPPEQERQLKLQMQAKIASGPKPTVGEIAQ